MLGAEGLEGIQAGHLPWDPHSGFSSSARLCSFSESCKAPTVCHWLLDDGEVSEAMNYSNTLSCVPSLSPQLDGKFRGHGVASYDSPPGTYTHTH